MDFSKSLTARSGVIERVNGVLQFKFEFNGGLFEGTL
jgi:hypothetical protein